MKVTYIYHSGFLVETDSCYYLFDYEKGNLPCMDVSKSIIVLSSHGHHDHYNPEIFSLLKSCGMQTVYAILSDDIEVPELTTVLQISPGNEYQLWMNQSLTTFESTDVGVAFLIEDQGELIYHAGDLNDWVWEEESDSYNEQMTKNYRKQIDLISKKLNGRKIDVAFVVLDPRQESNYDRGMCYFLEHVSAKEVYPMHYWGNSHIVDVFLNEHTEYTSKIKNRIKYNAQCAEKRLFMKFKMVHENYNVANLEKSIAFYEKALGLHEVRRKNGDGFVLVYMGTEEGNFELELTYLEEHPQEYNLGECEFHLAFETDDYEAAYKLHKEMGCICYENPAMGIYFIIDPDGYWLEIVPARK